MHLLPSNWDTNWFNPVKKGEREGAEDVHPLHRPCMPSREDFKKSPNYPLIMTPNPTVLDDQTFNGRNDPAQQLPINSPIHFDSPFWSGVFEVHIRNLPTTQKDKFEGKKRMFHFVCQGRYKYRCKAYSTCMGQEWMRHSKLPPSIGEFLMTAAGKVFSNTVHVNINCEHPYFLNPTLACHQIINVSRPGEEPPMWEAQEDMRLMSTKLVDKDGVSPMPAEKRRKFCDIPANIEDMYWEPDFVYTQHVWQHLIDFSSCKFMLGGLLPLDITSVMQGQAFQVLAKDHVTGCVGISVLLWHEKTLYHEAAAEEEQQDREKQQLSHQGLGNTFSKLGSGFRSMIAGRK